MKGYVLEISVEQIDHRTTAITWLRADGRKVQE
jgi:hypothetical protein